MRYSSALVLSTVAVGQAVAHNHKHASFHARRAAASKRGDYDNVNWEALSYDLSSVDWDSVLGKNKPSSTAAPEPPAATSSAVQVEEAAAPPSTPAPSSAAPAHTQAPAPSSTKEDKPKETEDSLIDQIGDAVSDIFAGLTEWCDKKGISQPGVNDKSDNGKMWIGGDSDWKANFINDGSEDGMVVCWNDNGFTGMTINVNQPMITINLAKGASQTVSFAANQPAACSIMYGGTSLANFGGIDNTWWEVTYGSTGAFDVSRNPNMNGSKIHSKGSKCTSDMDTCVFKCKDESLSSCTTGYDLFNCGASNGGGGGYDSVMQGTGGGCSMGNSGETIQVTFSN